MMKQMVPHPERAVTMSRRAIAIIMLLPLLTMLVAACSVGRPRVDPCDAGGVLLQDDFGGELNCGWATYNRGGSVVALEEGVLRLSTSQPGQVWWTNPGRNFEDVIITVQARQTSGPNDNAYGVICRYQDEGDFYIFLVSGDGYYAIGKYQGGNDQVTYLTPDGRFQFSEVINQGIATNQLRASCVGTELTLSVNGIQLLSVTDPAFDTGDVGLAASTLALGTAVIQFDNLLVLEP